LAFVSTITREVRASLSQYIVSSSGVMPLNLCATIRNWHSEPGNVVVQPTRVCGSSERGGVVVMLMQWDPDRLKADTMFVMGSKANKSVA